MRPLYLIPLVLFLHACATPEDDKSVTDQTAIPPTLTVASYRELPGWQSEDWKDFDTALTRSCERIARRAPESAFSGNPLYGTNHQWQVACEAYTSVDKVDPAATRAFFEAYFTPYSVTRGVDKDGLFTGYYESSLRGSRTRSAEYNIPLHARPDDLVMVNLGEFRDELKGQRIAGRVTDGNLKPYETRAEILAGKLKDEKVLVWVDDPVEAFFVQVQGSGVVQLDDGSIMRIGYAGQNGHIYYAIGRELVKRGVMPKEDVSMQSIRAWLEANPAQADELMNTNKSYVFFREIVGDGPIGGEGIALTPLRSLAIDHGKFPYGFPVWLQTDHPPLQRMMMAQDTGGAIKGAVRGDVFWGYGDEAEKMAGAMKSPGRYWILLPK